MIRATLTSAVLAAAACSIQAQQGEVGVYEAPSGGGGTSVADAGQPPLYFLTMTLRDFKVYDPEDPATNPAFGNVASEKSVVGDQLGADGKPVYRSPDNDLPTYGQEFFDQWYRDTPGVNHTVVFPLPMSPAQDGFFEYDSQKAGVADTYLGVDRLVFFPIDDGTPYATPFGNQGRTHNQAFTAEFHGVFTLSASGGVLQVRGDDDIYVFIDDQLVIDVGGTHVATEAELSLDAQAVSLGEEHTLDLFYAERLGATGDLLIRANFELRTRVD